MNECDLILAFGSSFSNHTGITPKRRIIQVDFDRMTLGKFHGVTVPVWAEIGVTAKLMLADIAGRRILSTNGLNLPNAGDLARGKTESAQ